MINAKSLESEFLALDGKWLNLGIAFKVEQGGISSEFHLLPTKKIQAIFSHWDKLRVWHLES